MLQSVGHFIGFLQASSAKGASTTSDSTLASEQKRRTSVKEQNGQPKVKFMQLITMLHVMMLLLCACSPVI